MIEASKYLQLLSYDNRKGLFCQNKNLGGQYEKI